MSVNQVTPALFDRYRSAADLAAADRGELEELIKPTGFSGPRPATSSGWRKPLYDRHDGEVPDTLDELVTLPGVGHRDSQRRAGNAFGVPGITVDTPSDDCRVGWAGPIITTR